MARRDITDAPHRVPQTRCNACRTKSVNANHPATRRDTPRHAALTHMHSTCRVSRGPTAPSRGNAQNIAAWHATGRLPLCLRTSPWPRPRRTDRAVPRGGRLDAFAEAWRSISADVHLISLHFGFQMVVTGSCNTSSGPVRKRPGQVPPKKSSTRDWSKAPVFFFTILGQCLRGRNLSAVAWGVARAGAAVLGTVLLLLGPWLLGERPAAAARMQLYWARCGEGVVGSSG